jgi:hypothetical protein
MDPAVRSSSRSMVQTCPLHTAVEQNPVSCRAMDSSVTRGPTPTRLHHRNMGLDAVIVLEMEAYGWFEGSDVLEMTTEVDVECEGGDCWAVELATAEMPCSMAVVLEAEPQ